MHTLSVRMAGFKKFEQTDLHLAESDSLATGPLKLEVGAVSETIKVKAEGATIETASAERSGLLDSKQIMELQSRGRDVMSLLQILPGVVNDNTGAYNAAGVNSRNSSAQITSARDARVMQFALRFQF